MKSIWADLCDLCLLPCWCAPKLVKGNVNPLIDIGMDLVVLVTDLLRGQALLQSLQNLHKIELSLACHRKLCKAIVGFGGVIEGTSDAPSMDQNRQLLCCEASMHSMQAYNKDIWDNVCLMFCLCQAADQLVHITGVKNLLSTSSITECVTTAKTDQDAMAQMNIKNSESYSCITMETFTCI